MSSQVWKALYRLIVRAARRQPRPLRRPKFSDALIVAMHYWSVAHDRPQCWACQRANYQRPFLPRRLPSVSQFNRRLRSPRIQTLLAAVELLSQAAGNPTRQWLDSRPLPVGACSKDRQACAGRISGGFARGYRLHACLEEKGYFLAWKVTPLNVSDKPVAAELLRRTRPRGLVLADGNYDAGHLYELAARSGGQLLATPRIGAGRGHRRPNPYRQTAVFLWQRHHAWIQAERKHIDRVFGQHSSYGGGLAPLPAWVRTLARVTRWVQAKIVLHHVRLTQRQRERVA